MTLIDMLFFLWQVSAVTTFAACAGCVVIHWQLGRQTPNRFGHYTLLSSSLLFGEATTTVLRLLAFSNQHVNWHVNEMAMGILGRCLFTAGMVIWGGYLLGIWNGIDDRPHLSRD